MRLIAPVLVSGFGETAALLACGAVVTAYCAVVWRSRPADAEASAAAAPLIGAPTVAMPAIVPAGPVPVPVLPPGRDALVG